MSKNIHPLADYTLGLLSRGTDEPYAIDAAAQTQLTEALGRYVGKKELRGAVRALVDVAHHVASRMGSRKAGSAIAAVAATALQALRQQSVAAQGELLNGKARDFARFGARTEAARRAPMIGAFRPDARTSQLRVAAMSRKLGLSSAAK